MQGTELNATFKLFAPLDEENYFAITENESFEDNLLNQIIFNDKEYSYCVSSCAQEKNCGAFAYKSPLKECKIWLKNKNEEKYDWSKLKTVKDEQSKIGRKNENFEGAELLSNKDYLDHLKDLIESQEGMHIYFSDTEFNMINLKATSLTIHSNS